MLLFSKGALNLSKVSVKVFIILRLELNAFQIKINSVLLNIQFIKESWKKWSSFHKNIKCF